MSRPLDFLVVGAPRSGTTSLFRYLQAHPGLFVPAAKEVPFFTDERWLARGWEAFLAEFYAGAPPDRLWGKVTPHYWSPEVAPRLRRQMPEVRLLALLRNPVDRAFSHYRFLVRRGVEPRPFEEAVAEPAAGRYDYLSSGEYARILAGYLTHFPREQMLILFTEELEAEPRRLLAAVQRHLGLAEPFPSRGVERRYNVGGTTTRWPWLIPLLRRTALRRVWRSLPERMRRSVGHWYFFEVAPKREPPPRLPPDVRRRLVDRFRADVARLDEILGRPVPWPEFRG